MVDRIVHSVPTIASLAQVNEVLVLQAPGHLQRSFKRIFNISSKDASSTQRYEMCF